jgi:L-alanine-DL-glutamate epimerase-like enolase superfamily enzyme
VQIDSYSLDGCELQLGPEFTRLTTVIRLQGGGHDGAGEDVTYDGLDQMALQDAGPNLPITGSFTLTSLRERLDELDLFPAAPVRELSRLYRRWAYESAALDLALRQAGTSLHAALGREMRPVNFVTSMRLGEPATTAPLRRRLEAYPTLQFKLDPTPSWDDALVAELAGLGVVDTVDLKGFYSGTVVDNPPDPVLYRRVVEAFPAAWIEDPALTPETGPVLEPHRDRITWDAPIHSIADIEALPFPPKMVNIKPSRFGGLRELFAAYDWCEARAVGAYGGGQHELGPGRGHIQYLASLFHADTPNDVAPTGYNDPSIPAGLPASPLDPQPSATGFRWGE